MAAAAEEREDKEDKEYKPYPSFRMDKQRKSKRLDKEVSHVPTYLSSVSHLVFLQVPMPGLVGVPWLRVTVKEKNYTHVQFWY